MIHEVRNSQDTPWKQSSTAVLDWTWLNHLKFTEESRSISGKEIRLFRLENTPLNATSGLHIDSMECRIAFVKHAIADVCSHCPKDEELSIVSLGSDHLLLEYLFGRGLMENGFQHLSFFNIEPSYKFSVLPQSHFEELKDGFRSKLILDYFELGYGLIGYDKFQYFSKAKDVQSTFTKNSNVVLLECMPPYHILNDPAVYSLPLQKNLFSGSHVVSDTEANGLIFLPYKNVTLTSSTVPLCRFIDKDQKQKCIDWGCRIYSDGRYFVGFHGSERYYPELTEHISRIKESIESAITKQLEAFKTPPQLSQQQITEILRKVKNLISTIDIGWDVLPISDYNVDRSELIDFLKLNAGNHYRKGFALVSDPVKTYEINNIHF